MTRLITSNRTLPLLAVVLLVLWIAAPYSTQAQQGTDDLRATIRAELLSDPRTSGMTSAQIDAAVDALTQEAQRQGITSQDIQWRPQGPERFVPSEEGTPAATECAGGFLCTMTEAFGFIGADTTIPFTLGAASMGLIWIIAEMLHRRRHPAQAPVSTPTSAM